MRVTNETSGPIKAHNSGVGIEPHVVSKRCNTFDHAARSLERAPGDVGLETVLFKCLPNRHGGWTTSKSKGTARDKHLYR